MTHLRLIQVALTAILLSPFFTWATGWSFLLIADETRQKPQAVTWGSDHVGQVFPDYVTGDECLFCHRDVGKNWADNRHTLTVRPVADAAGPKDVSSVTHVIGHQRKTHYLRRSNAYGKFDLSLDGKNTWDQHTFGDRCVGCHMTAVDTESRSFSSLAIDCVACHGVVNLQHSKQPELALLSPSKKQDALVATSICGQCHLRGGHSRSTGLPYPNTFVPGDNLFLDYQVDLTRDAINGVPPTDRHIFQNVAEVVHGTKTDLTCLSCHNVHQNSSEKHQSLPDSQICQVCHNKDHTELTDEYLQSRPPRGHSATCKY